LSDLGRDLLNPFKTFPNQIPSKEVHIWTCCYFDNPCVTISKVHPLNLRIFLKVWLHICLHIQIDKLKLDFINQNIEFDTP